VCSLLISATKPAAITKPVSPSNGRWSFTGGGQPGGERSRSQLANTNRAPGLTTRATSRSAASVSGTIHRTSTLIAASNVQSANRSAERSPTSNRARPSTPNSLIRRGACPTATPERSTPTSDAPVARATHSPGPPRPHPKSMIAASEPPAEGRFCLPPSAPSGGVRLTASRDTD
jgi:hypothetical protein